MTIHGTQWSFLTKLLWKFFRPEIEKIVKDSTNTVDDTILTVADKLLGS